MNLTCLGYYTRCMNDDGQIVEVGLMFENEEGRMYYSGNTRIEALKYHIERIQNQENGWFIQSHPRYTQWSGQNYFNAEILADPEDANRVISNGFRQLSYDEIRELLRANYRIDWSLNDEALDFYKEFIKEFLYYSIAETNNAIEPGEFGLTDKGDIYFYLGYFRHKIKIIDENNGVLHEHNPDRKKHFYIKIKKLIGDIGFYSEELREHLKVIVRSGIEDWDSNGSMRTVRASLSKVPFVQKLDLMDDFQTIDAGNIIQFKMNSKQLLSEIRRHQSSNLVDNSLHSYSWIRTRDVEDIVGKNFILQIEIFG